MKRTYADYIGEYYDNLDQALDLSEFDSVLDQKQLRKIVQYDQRT